MEFWTPSVDELRPPVGWTGINEVPGLGPAAEPVDLQAAKRQCQVDDTFTEDDVYINGLISTARELVEEWTGRVTVVRTLEAVRECFPWSRELRLPRTPLVSVSSVTYTLEDGTVQTFPSSSYVVDTKARQGRIVLQESEDWPADPLEPGSAVAVEFVAGYATPFEVHAAQDSIRAFGRTFEDGDRVELSNSGASVVGATLPGDLAERTQYFVVNSTGAVFSLSDTDGGAAIDITTGTSDGTPFIGRVPAKMIHAILLLVAHWYENREGVQEARRTILLELPLGIRALVLADRVW